MSDEKESAFVDYYALLGVATGATTGEIRKHFLQHAKEHHPDAGGAHDTMQLLNKAYETLKDSTSRQAYDMLHQFHTGTSQLHYRTEGPDNDIRSNIPDDLVDSFIDSIFTEYSAPKPKQTLHEKVKKRFRNK